jgi:hypothetical protein
MDMPPAFMVPSTRVGADEQIGLPIRVALIGWVERARYMRLSCVGKFNLGTFLVTIGAMDQDHVSAPPLLLRLRQSTGRYGNDRD